jgi:RNA polymerase sigma-70 factor (ECF subfamily)
VFVSAGEPAANLFDQWLAGVQTGSTPISGELVRTCREYLLLVADRNLDRDLQRKLGPSDLVQETFLHAQKNFDQFRGQSEEELLSWLKQILLNHLIDESRKYRQTAKRQLSRERPLADSQGMAPLRAPSAGERSPRAEAILHEEIRMLSKALEQLPDDHQEVLMLRNWDRLSFKEIGERMGRSHEATRKLWTRAIERLQRELEASHDD